MTVAEVRATELVEALLAGQRRALARAITLVENRDPAGEEILRALYPRTGRAHVIGVTGAPGVGKSTLVNALIGRYRQRGNRVGVVAVDPSSPFTGGAILGDRIRLAAGPRDEGVYFRSLANRGQAGGVSRATQDVIHLLDAAGFEVVILETVGAGQSEVDVMRFAHTVLVLSVPGLGDEVQASKAGILEIGDVFVVNKADRDGADRLAAELRLMLSLASDDGGWQPPVVKTVATTGAGLDELVDAIERHRAFLRDHDVLERRRRELAERQIGELLTERLLGAFRRAAGSRWQAVVADVAERRRSPAAAAELLLGDAKVLAAMTQELSAGAK